MHAITLDAVTKGFNGHKAVDSLDLKVPTGSIFGLLGPNGAGKTTTIRMVMNILIPDEGRIEVLGQPIDDHLKEHIGYLPEERGLYGKMKVLDVLLYLASLKGVKRSEASRRATGWLKRMGLEQWTDKKVEELSKGMQQKVQFIVAVIHQPDLLILDEPFSGLDPVNTDLLKEMILEQHEAGRTIIFSTHIMEQVEKLCDTICLINRGQKVLDGGLAEVKRSYGQDTIALEYDGEAPFLDDTDLVESADRYGHYAEIRLARDIDPQEFLGRVVESGCQVRKFQIMEPTLHNIFIQIVGGEKEE